MDPYVRASDIDRERVVEALQQHVADGRITLDEFDQRSAAAYAASTIGDLGAVVADLPPLAEPANATAARATGTAIRPMWILVAVIATLAGAGLVGGMADAAAAGAMMDGMCH